MSKTISISSCKGGISKSTSTINIGAALAMLGHKVLLVDNDPQSSLTAYLNLKEQVEISLPQLMKAATENIKEDQLHQMVRESVVHAEALDVIPSHISMSGLEMGLSAMPTGREYILSDILSHVKQEYDFVLIDCLPALGVFTINALTASDSVIVPVETHFGALEGFDQILNTIRMIRKRLNPNLQIEGVLLAKHQAHTKFCRNIKDLIWEDYGELLKIF